MEFSPERLKELSTDNVKSLVAEGTPLNDSIIALAESLELNPEQIKRLVEMSNQLAYLAQLESADDRTFEFDVADYDSIVDSMLPEASIEKSASDLSDIASIFDVPMEKVASEASVRDLSDSEKTKALTKVASEGRCKLTDLWHQGDALKWDIVKQAEALKKDEKVFEKIAHVSESARMANLLGGEVVESTTLYSQDDLAGVKSLSDTLEKAAQVVSEIKDLTPKVEHAEEMVKQAFLAPLLANSARVVGNTMKSIPGVERAGASVKKVADKMAANKTTSRMYNAWSVTDSAAEVSRGTNRTYDAWNSLRG